MSTEIDKLVSSTSDQNQTIIRILDIIYRKTTQEKGNFNLPKQISSVMTAFNTEISNANKMNSYYAIIKMANENIIDELYDVYSNKNDELNKVSKDFTEDILTNNRKTYYEQNGITELKAWYNFWWYIYYILILVLIIAIFTVTSTMSRITTIVITILLVFYPYYIHPILLKIYNIFSEIKKLFPINVYNTL